MTAQSDGITTAQSDGIMTAQSDGIMTAQSDGADPLGDRHRLASIRLGGQACWI